MLSHHERRALHEIERQLLADDPAFAESFDRDARGRRFTGPFGWRLGHIGLVALAVCGVLMAIFGAPISGLVLIAVAATLWWVGHRRNAR